MRVGQSEGSSSGSSFSSNSLFPQKYNNGQIYGLPRQKIYFVPHILQKDGKIIAHEIITHDNKNTVIRLIVTLFFYLTAETTFRMMK